MGRGDRAVHEHAGRPSPGRRRVLAALPGLLWPASRAWPAGAPPAPSPAPAPVPVGLIAALSVTEWTTPPAIRAGIEVAIDEINRSGGVLGGRPLQLQLFDHRSMAARAVRGVETFAGTPDLPAMFCDAYSPAALEMVSPAQRLGVPLLDPWAAADGITDHGMRPSFTFRLSLRDSWVMPVLLRDARERDLRRIGMMVVSNGWGRGNEDALRAALTATAGRQSLVGVRYHAPDASAEGLSADLAALRAAGADVVVLVGLFADNCRVISLMRRLPAAERRPILSHWGVLAGDYEPLLRDDLAMVDVRVVQTFSPARQDSPHAQQVLGRARQRLGLPAGAAIPSVAGVAHAYDLTHMLALAIDRAGTLRRDAVRDALESLPGYAGITKRFVHPFRDPSHEALSARDVFIGRLLPGIAAGARGATA